MSDYILKAKNKKKKVKGTKRRQYKKSVTKSLDSRTNRLEKRKNKYPSKGRLISQPGSKTKSKIVTTKRAARLKKRAQGRPLKRKLSTVGQRVKRVAKKAVRKVVRGMGSKRKK